MQENDTVLILGATSSMAQAIARALAKKSYSLVLCGRDEHELELLSGDLKTRYGTSCRMVVCDILETKFSADSVIAQAGDFQHMLIAIGEMASTNADDPDNIRRVMHVNYTIPAQLASSASLHMAQHGGGTLAIISSVAGDRGRQSNYIYASAKAALSTFASGLRNRYSKLGVHVLTIKPGFVDTPMTWGMKSPLIASREYVANKIVAAMEKQKNVVYVPWFWKWIMLIILHIPEGIFKKLKL